MLKYHQSGIIGLTLMTPSQGQELSQVGDVIQWLGSHIFISTLSRDSQIYINNTRSLLYVVEQTKRICNKQLQNKTIISQVDQTKQNNYVTCSYKTRQTCNKQLQTKQIYNMQLYATQIKKSNINKLFYMFIFNIAKTVCYRNYN